MPIEGDDRDDATEVTRLLDVAPLARGTPAPESPARAGHLTQVNEANGLAKIASPIAAEFVPLRLPDFDWWLSAEFLDEIGSPGAIVHHAAHPPAGAIAKMGPHRSVTRMELPSGNYYVKRFRIAGLRPVLQNLVRPCKAALEWDALRRLVSLGLPTVQPVGLGRETRHGLVWESYLVTASIDGAVALDQFVATELLTGPRSRQVLFKHELAHGLGELIGQMHARGAVHPDLHPGNVLVRVEGNTVRLWLIDLHAVRFQETVTPEQAALSLAALNQLFGPRSSRSALRRFFQAYSQARGWSSTEERATLRSFARWCDEETQQLWNRADRAWDRGNRHQCRLDAAHTACRGLATLDPQWLTSVRDSPETLFEQGLQWWCKKAGRRRVAAVAVPATQGPTHAFFKAIENTGAGRWLDRLRRSAVRRAWDTGHAFLRRGIATPRPLLYVESRGLFSDREYLMTEAVPRSVTLAEFCQTVWPTLSRGAQREWLDGVSRQLARQLHWMHVCRFDHRDLKFENILVPSDADRQETWLLDLDAVRRWPLFPQARVVQNLARLNVSTFHLPVLSLSERLRFLRRYLGKDEWSRWKWWWRQIDRKSRLKEAQNRRRGRPLS